jgi:lipoyl(octanoyl) transferase
MFSLFLKYSFEKVPYLRALHEMERWQEEESQGCVWILEHEPMITLGRIGTEQDILSSENKIPHIYTSRGGQATYHGPGQIVVYTLLHLKNHNLKLTDYRNYLNTWVFRFLEQWNLQKLWIEAPEPGFWIYNPQFQEIQKWGFIGLRIHQGWISHGFSLNILKSSLKGFGDIIPCGLGRDSPKKEITCLQDMNPSQEITWNEALNKIIHTCPWF